MFKFGKHRVTAFSTDHSDHRCHLINQDLKLQDYNFKLYSILTINSTLVVMFKHLKTYRGCFIRMWQPKFIKSEFSAVTGAKNDGFAWNCHFCNLPLVLRIHEVIWIYEKCMWASVQNVGCFIWVTVSLALIILEQKSLSLCP